MWKTSGLMLTQVQPSLPQAFDFERYPILKTQQVCLVLEETFLFSCFKTYCSPKISSFLDVFTETQRVSFLAARQQACLQRWHLRLQLCEYEEKSGSLKMFCLLLNCIIVGVPQGVGRRKCPDDRRQHNSHFCLCHDGADRTTEETGGNFAAVNVPTRTRRFPRNHKQKSAEAALELAGEQFMWFGRHDSDLSDTLQVLAANGSAPSRP